MITLPYDNGSVIIQIRHCCEGASICPKCWKFMTNAMVVLKDVLTNEFGFKHILFVYSGRRGVHIWVCDHRARRLTDSQRKAIVDYLSFSSISNTMDYSLIHCAELLRPFFEEFMIAEEGQDVLRYDANLDVHEVTGGKRELLQKKYQKQRFLPLLECLPSNFSQFGKLETYLKSDRSPIEKWESIQGLLRDVDVDDAIHTSPPTTRSKRSFSHIRIRDWIETSLFCATTC
jgi:singapore isolate B (sub-type 7) whole genome shotgun sequence assembly, scaffold_3